MRNSKGLTLVELIVTLAIAAMVIPLMYSVFFVGTASYSISTNKGFAQQDIRLAADFLTGELRYVTDLSDTDFVSSEYYSLRINNEGKLVKSKYVMQDDDTVVETTLNSVSGNWEHISIVNTTPGLIDVVLEQTEHTGSRDAGFKLPMTITTENSPNMHSNISLDLLSGDILYYQNTKTTSLSNSIYLNKLDEEVSELVTVKFYSNYGESYLVSSVTDMIGVAKPLPTVTNRPGYTLKSWNTSNDGSGISYGSGGNTTFIMPTNNTDLYAVWEENGVIGQVTVDTAFGTDGVVQIDTNNPAKNADGRFIVEKNDGSKIKVKLNGYTSAHKDRVKITVHNSTIAIEEDKFLVFNAIPTKNGNNEKFEVEITIVTNGTIIYKKIYQFITN